MRVKLNKSTVSYIWKPIILTTSHVWKKKKNIVNSFEYEL